MSDDPKPHLDENGFVVLDHDDEPSSLGHLDPAAVVACQLCDDDGYTAARRVCDHVDRSETAARGSAAVRAALAKGQHGGAA